MYVAQSPRDLVVVSLKSQGLHRRKPELVLVLVLVRPYSFLLERFWYFRFDEKQVCDTVPFCGSLS